MHYEGLILIAAGCFTAAGGLFDWDWFMGARKAEFFVKMLGRDGARVFYGALGGVLAIIGILILVGVIPS
ncbi:MAG: immunity 17 family protein [Spirochaetes bacterium]|nr:immunity 17 family protein [Spirochaetota bacterium]MBU1080563.1 immunity 17 family protein [Spirochaetota bacterium]